MAVVTVVLLLVGVAGAILRPLEAPAWVVPLGAAVVVVAAGGLSLSHTRQALDPLAQPIGFLLAAVPLAVMLDRLGFFTSLAALLTRGERGVGGLWVLAALVTTVLNLDASVVLLTPLYVRIARRTGRDPLTLALMPVLLACLASSALPVSNLTNLIAASATGASAVQFLAHLGLPSLAATVVGWFCYRRFLHPERVLVTVEGAEAGSPPNAADRRSLLVGFAVVVPVLIGFTAGRLVGIEPWTVALAADVVVLAMVRSLPWRDVPVGTALVALSLGVLAAGAVGHLPVGAVLRGTSVTSLARITGTMTVAANLVNNLPALLVALRPIGAHVTPTLWSVLLGVNMGPVLLATGSLASLLWLDALGRLGIPVRARDFSAAGVRVGLPAAVVAVGVQLGLHVTGIAR